MRPGAFLEHGAPFRRRHALDDEAQRLAGGVSVDRANPMNHCVKELHNLIGCR